MLENYNESGIRRLTNQGSRQSLFSERSSIYGDISNSRGELASPVSPRDNTSLTIPEVGVSKRAASPNAAMRRPNSAHGSDASLSESPKRSYNPSPLSSGVETEGIFI
jgi:hypothetical protein